MRLVKADHVILSPLEPDDVMTIYLDIERAGRTAYCSFDKMADGSARKFVEMIVKRGHDAVLEFGTITVEFNTDRGVSHELVRHRIGTAFVQQSTRYCNYSKDNDRFDGHVHFVIPPWTEIPCGVIDILVTGHVTVNGIPVKDDDPLYDNFGGEYVAALVAYEAMYKAALLSGWSPQQARTLLPHSTLAPIVVKANLREWLHILKLRTSKAAHPQMREVMIPLGHELAEAMPEIFGEFAKETA